MSKIIINEAELNRIISECVKESLSEGGGKDFLNKVGGAAKSFVQGVGKDIKNNGGLVSWGANKIGNFQKKIRDFGDKVSDAYQNGLRGNSANQTSSQNTTGNMDTPSSVELEPNPTLMAQQNNKSTGAIGQTTGKNNRQTVANKAQQIIQQKANYLKERDFQLVNGQWVYTKDGSNSPALQSQYPDIVQAAKAYDMAVKGAKGMYEAKIKSIKKQLNEIQKKTAKLKK